MRAIYGVCYSAGVQYVSGQETTDKYHLSKNRLEALFDGIFAFSMTLLVTGFVIQPIPAPDVMVEFPARIAAMRP